MTSEWPDHLDEFGEFLVEQGLSFERKGIVPQSGDKLWQYGNSQLGVRVVADKGLVWSVRVADIAGWPNQWYAACELREMLIDEHESCSEWPREAGIAGQIRFVEEKWASIADAFAPLKRRESHETLKQLAKRRSRRDWV